MTHSDTFLLIGPVPPLLPDVVRVRLRLRVLAAAAALLALVALAATAIVVQSRAVPNSGLLAFSTSLPNPFGSRSSNTETVPVVVASDPTGASILLDNHELARTPAQVHVKPDALLKLHLDGFLDDFVRANAPAPDVMLWRAQPDVRILRPPLPGSMIRSANFLPDGTVSLEVEVPPSAERQVWAYDPPVARMTRLGQADAPGGALPSVVAQAPDGVRSASIFHLDGLDGAAADQLEIDGPEGRLQPLGDAAPGERLLALNWSPTSSGLLLVSQRRVASGASYQLSFVGTNSQIRELLDLPEQPVSGSWVWAPDGNAVAFLVGPRMALTTLDLATGTMRYIADVQAGFFPSTGAVAPATWGAAEELLYAGPPTSGVAAGVSSGAPVLFEVSAGRLDTRRLGDVEPVWAPIVREDGIILTLARGTNDELVLRPVDPAGHALAEQRLGVQVSGPFAARWDLVHRQLLIIRGATGSGIQVLLLGFGGDKSQTASMRYAGSNNQGAVH